MESLKIGVINYGMGNIQSVNNVLTQLGHEVFVTQSHKDFNAFDVILLPGVGHFGKAMSELNRLNLLSPLNDLFHEGKTQMIGICLGMQLMAKGSEEGDVEGLGWIDGQVIKLNPKNPKKYKTPHLGWNTVHWKNKPLASADNRYYFVHGFALQVQNESQIIGTTEYETSFVSVCGEGKAIGFQFHPEKSHIEGQTLLKNVLS